MYEKNNERYMKKTCDFCEPRLRKLAKLTSELWWVCMAYYLWMIVEESNCYKLIWDVKQIYAVHLFILSQSVTIIVYFMCEETKFLSSLLCSWHFLFNFFLARLLWYSSLYEWKRSAVMAMLAHRERERVR